MLKLAVKRPTSGFYSNSKVADTMTMMLVSDVLKNLTDFDFVQEGFD